MSYEKQTWAKGDIVTSTKLNHMEDGIAGGGGESGILYTAANVTAEAVTLTNTWKEINDADYAIFVSNEEGRKDYGLLLLSQDTGESFEVTFLQGSAMTAVTFTTDNENGYPAISIG